MAGRRNVSGNFYRHYWETASPLADKKKAAETTVEMRQISKDYRQKRSGDFAATKAKNKQESTNQRKNNGKTICMVYALLLTMNDSTIRTIKEAD